MNKTNKKYISFILMIFLLISVFGCNQRPVSVETTIREISKYGNIELEYSATEFLDRGFAYGDIITVHISGTEYEMPIGSNYADVDTNSLVCRLEISAESKDDNVILAINMGDLATDAGIANKVTTESEPGYRWDYCEGFDSSSTITLSLKEEGGYLDEYTVRNLVRTNERTDYTELSDADFANFREITTGIGAGRLYRSSSPINPESGRNTYADNEIKSAGVKTVVNLADTEDTAKGYTGYEDSYYSTTNVIFLNLAIDFRTEEFRKGIADGLRHIASNEGPYLIHCTEGKDRAGFTSALIECLMGAGADEVIEDYMRTYINYYGIEKDSDQYAFIAESNVKKFLAEAFDVDDIEAENVNLADEAYDYVTRTLGLTPDEVNNLKANLSE